MRKAAEPLALAEASRLAAGRDLDQHRRTELGQFLTPAPIASFMASMFHCKQREVRLLDAGAGVGSLTAAFVAEMCRRRERPRAIHASVYEIDAAMLGHLRSTLEHCAALAVSRRIALSSRTLDEDFIEAGSALLDPGLFRVGSPPPFNMAILNPPYRKIHSQSKERALLRAAGIETSNLYTAFVGLALKLLEPGGELVAITPRSFCNGPYFKTFRELLFNEAALAQVHVFEARNRAFEDDDVLQENIIFHVRKGSPRTRVILSVSAAPGDPIRHRTVAHDAVVSPADPNAVVHLAVSSDDAEVAERMHGLPCKLADLGVSVSTGRVVDFRVKAHLRMEPGASTVPLIYPAHFEQGFVAWPRRDGRKPNALADTRPTKALMVESGTYVLTKRFTSKEEPRRVVAAVYAPERLPESISHVGFENHLNYFHAGGAGLRTRLAKGLAAYLNSSLVDRFFRQFNGHTQVNATDLRSIRYPSPDQLEAMGRRIGTRFPGQDRIDQIVDAVTSC